jgi:hypothetical protein
MCNSRIGARLTAFVLVSALLLGGSAARGCPAVAAGGDGPTVTYAYDGAGRLVEANYGAIHITYVYDDAGNLVARELTWDVYLPLVLRDVP